MLLLLAAFCFNLPERASAATTVRAGVARSAAAQAPAQEPHILAPGRDFEAEMSGGDRRLFKIRLESAQYLRVVVEQHGILLSAALIAPSGGEVVRADNPCGAYGPVYVSTISGPAGDYSLEVKSKEPWANPGRYIIRVEELRTAAATDRDRVAAEKAYADGRHLSEEQKSYKAALKKFEESLSYWRQVGDRHWLALTEFCLAVTHRSLGERKEAAEHFGKSIAVVLDEYDWRLRASALNDAGSNYYYWLGDFERAMKFLNEALDLYQKHQDRKGQASAYNNMGNVYLQANRPREADEVLRKALPLRQAEHDRVGEIIVLNNLGGIADRLGEPYVALANFSAALRAWQELEQRGELTNPLALPIGFNNVALAYDRLSDWQLALENYREALRRFQNVAPVEAAKTLDNIGELYAVLGDTRQAMEYYDKARTLAEGKDQVAAAKVFNHIGQVYVSEGKLAGALGYFERALALNENDSDKASAHTNIGTVYVLQGNPRRALEPYALALKLSEDGENKRGQALALNKTGEAHLLLGEYETALEDFNRALPLWTALADRGGEAATLYGLALVERARKNLSAALARSEESLNIIESLRTKVASQRLRASYFASQQNYYELYVDLRMKLYQQDRSPQHLAEALEASERARARSLMDTLAEARADIYRGISPSLVTREREAQRRLNDKARAQMLLLNSRKYSEAEAAALERELNEAIVAYDSVKTAIRASSPAYAHLTQPRSLKLREIQQMLDENTLLIEYLLGEERSYAWAISRDSITAVPLPKRAEIEKAALAFYKSLTTPQPPQNTAGSAALSETLLGPFAEQLGKKRLLIVGDGILQYLPFGALPVPASRGENAYLIEDHEFVYLPSASTLAMLRNETVGRRSAPLSVAVLADPVFDANDSRLKTNEGGKPAPAASPPDADREAVLRSGFKLIPLPATEKEAREIRDAVAPNPVKVSLGFEASRAAVLELQEENYRVIHFATHGVFNAEHPELSGIVLSMVDARGQTQDGVLRLHDIYNLKLSAEMVVLSACSTGLGSIIKGEGMIGLTRGFMYAGAPRVVASLWRVEDLGTSELMKRFYSHMAKDGLAPATALRQAQRDMLKRKRWSAPYYWAGFILQGEWRPAP